MIEIEHDVFFDAFGEDCQLIAGETITPIQCIFTWDLSVESTSGFDFQTGEHAIADLMPASYPLVKAGNLIRYNETDYRVMQKLPVRNEQYQIVVQA